MAAVLAVCFSTAIESEDRFLNVPKEVQKRAAGDIKEWVGKLLDADLNHSDFVRL